MSLSLFPDISLFSGWFTENKTINNPGIFARIHINEISWLVKINLYFSIFQMKNSKK